MSRLMSMEKVNPSQELYFEIFKETKDFGNWNKYREFIERNPEFDEERRNLLLEMYKFFKGEFGRRHLEGCHWDGRNLVNFWLHSRGNCFGQLKWMFDAMSFFKAKDCNYEKLRGRLSSCDRCNLEGVPFLVVGDSLRKSDFDVVFEPKLNISEFLKRPDIKIIDTKNNQEIFIEVTKLNYSDERNLISSNHRTIIDFFRNNPPYVPFLGKIHKTATTEELMELKTVIMEARQNVFEHGTFIKIRPEETLGILEFGVSNLSKRAELEEWGNKQKFSEVGSLLGLPLDFDYTSRLQSKLEDEAEQIPKDFPGLIYIPVPAEYLFFGVPDWELIKKQVRKTMTKDHFSNIVGVCIYSHLGNFCEEELVNGDDFFERKMVHEYIQQDVIFIRNLNCKINIHADSLKRVYDSFQRIFCSN